MSQLDLSEEETDVLEVLVRRYKEERDLVRAHYEKHPLGPPPNDQAAKQAAYEVAEQMVLYLEDFV